MKTEHRQNIDGTVIEHWRNIDGTQTEQGQGHRHIRNIDKK